MFLIKLHLITKHPLVPCPNVSRIEGGNLLSRVGYSPGIPNSRTLSSGTTIFLRYILRNQLWVHSAARSSTLFTSPWRPVTSSPWRFQGLYHDLVVLKPPSSCWFQRLNSVHQSTTRRYRRLQLLHVLAVSAAFYLERLASIITSPLRCSFFFRYRNFLKFVNDLLVPASVARPLDAKARVIFSRTYTSTTSDFLVRSNLFSSRLLHILHVMYVK